MFESNGEPGGTGGATPEQQAQPVQQTQPAVQDQTAVDDDETLGLARAFEARERERQGQSSGDGESSQAGGETAGQQEAPGEQGQSGDRVDPNDPLSGLSVEDILKHPKLGRELRSYADRGAAKQITSAIERMKAANRLAEYDSMTDEQRRTALQDPELAAEYSKLQGDRQAALDEEEASRIGVSAQVYGAAVLVRTISSQIEKAGLPADVKARLDPENYKDYGLAGLDKWQEDVLEAIAEDRANKRGRSESELEREARRQEALADNDSRMPTDIASGRRTNAGSFNLDTEDDSAALAAAFAKRAPSKP